MGYALSKYVLLFAASTYLMKLFANCIVCKSVVNTLYRCSRKVNFSSFHDISCPFQMQELY